MASNPISKKDIAKKDAFNDFIKGAKQSLDSINDLTDGLKLLGDQQKKNIEILKKQPDTVKKSKEIVKAIKEVDDTVDALNQTEEARIAIDKKIIAAEKKLNESRDAKTKDLIKIKRLTQDQNKINKDNEIINNKSIGTLKKLTAQNRKLRREREGLNLEDEKALVRLKEINESLDKNNEFIKENSDSLKKQKLNVGNYKDEIVSALGETNLFSGALGDMSGAGSIAVDLFTQLKGTITDVEKAEGAATSATNKFSTALKSTGIAAIIALVASLGAAFTSTREGTLEFDKLMAKVTGSLGVFIAVLTEFGKAFILQFKSVSALLSGEFAEASRLSTEATKKMVDAFDNLGGRLEFAIEANTELIQLQFDQLDVTRKLEREIAKLQAREELQQAISDDATKSFKEREEAIFRAIELTDTRIRKEKELAESQLDFANRQLLIELKAKDTSIALDNEQLENLINNDKLRGLVSEDALAKQQDAILSLIELENELALVGVEQQKTVNELKQDRLERDLDILIDGFDNQKTINERLIADDRKTLREKEKIFEETIALADSSFRKQKEILAELSNAGIDVDALLKLDAVELNKKIRGLEQSEIIEGRTLEVIRERKIVLQDLADIQKDLAEQAEREARAQEEIVNQLDQVLKAGEIAAEEDFFLRQERKRNALQDQADFEIFLAEDNAAKIEVIRAKLANDLAAIDRATAKRKESDAEKEAKIAEELRKKRIDAAKDLANQFIDIALEELAKKNQARLDDLDAQITEAEDSVRQQQEIAAAGGTAIIGEEKARLAKLKLERKREQEAQAKQERNIALAQNFVNALASYSKEDPKTAFAKATFETFAGGAFAKLIAGFEKGGLVEGNEQIIKINEKGQEFVIDAPTTKALGLDKKGSSMASFNQMMGNNLDLSPSHFKQLEVGNMMQPNNVNLAPMIASLEKQTDRLEKAISKGQTSYHVDWNSKNEAIERVTRDKVTTIIKNKRPRL